ncbi:MAG: type II and III secretion system protein [Bacteroidota bacterium]|jgi:type IV pilus assembly protein PilQ
MKKRGIVIFLTISFAVIAYGQKSESDNSLAVRTQQSDTLSNPVGSGGQQIPVRNSNSPVGNIIPLPLKPVLPEQKRDTLSPRPDTLSSSSTAPVSMPDTITVSNLVLPQGAKDTTSLSFRDTDLRDIFRALAAKHSLNIFIDNTINKHSTISLSNVQVYDAIKFICKQNNLMLGLEGGIFKIMPPPPLKVELPPPKVPWVYYENNLLSVKLKNDDLEAVVLEIQKKCSKNILIISGTSGSLSGTLNDIDFDLGFTQLLNNNGFAIQKKNGIYVVSRLEYFVGQQTQGGAQKAGPYWISVHDSLVSVDVTNAPLDRVLNDIGRQLNTDMIFYTPVTGTITARATNIPLEHALNLFLRNTNFTYLISDGMYFIGEKTNKTMTSTKLLRLKYLRAEKILETIPQSITSQAVLKVIKEHNGFVIAGSNDIITQMEEYLQAIDKPVAQVLIEAIVVDYDRTKALDLGVKAGFLGSKDTTTSFSRTEAIIPNVDIMFSGNQLNNALNAVGATNLGKLSPNFYLNLQAMEQKGIANIKSRPLLATLNGHPAMLTIGTTFYFELSTTTPFSQNQNQTYLSTSQQFTTVDADTKLEITPYVGSDGQITVEIKPDFKTPQGQPVNGIPPNINRRAMSSTLVMREGETIVLGGMVQESESDSRTQVPILGSIPLLGYLFSSTSHSTNKSELVIYITPHISYGEAFHNVNLPMHEE